MEYILEKNIKWCGKDLFVQVGKFAKQSDSSVFLKYAGTTILCTAVVDKNEIEFPSFFPLTVNFSSKSYAFGKIPGGFYKREGKPSEHEILISRLIDRSIRPFFDKIFNRSVNISCILMSHDCTTSPDIAAMVASSIAALLLPVANIKKIIGSVRVCKKNNSIFVNPTISELDGNEADIVVSGTEENISMIDSQINELNFDEIVDLISIAQKSINELIVFIKDIKDSFDKIGYNNIISKHSYLEIPNIPEKIIAIFKEEFKDNYFEIFQKKMKKDTTNLLHDFNKNIIQKIKENNLDDGNAIIYVENFSKQISRKYILENNKRLDGREFDEIRNITTEIEILKQAHGSSLFTRGNTQVMAITTLGMTKDQQSVECLNTGMEIKERFFLHYNFASFSTGEVSKSQGPTRRDVGHGRLALKSFSHVLPKPDVFSHTIRVVAEVLESDGSSSMATVCATSMSLMDAGVPIRKPVAGIAMGLIEENDRYIILSDISGAEDVFGDIDFKVAGTDFGITALQMDIKTHGVSIEIIRDVLKKASIGINHILLKMNKSISESKGNVRGNFVASSSIKIDKSKIKDVIGSGGKVIKNICDITSAIIDIANDGNVNISGANLKIVNDAKSMIMDIVMDPVIGEVYLCKVVKLIEFGALVSFASSKQGLIHFSEISSKAMNELEIGSKIHAILVSIDGDRFKLSVKKIEANEKKE